LGAKHFPNVMVGVPDDATKNRFAHLDAQLAVTNLNTVVFDKKYLVFSTPGFASPSAKHNLVFDAMGKLVDEIAGSKFTKDDWGKTVKVLEDQFGVDSFVYKTIIAKKDFFETDKGKKKYTHEGTPTYDAAKKEK